MKIKIETQATLKSMDYGLPESGAKYAEEAMAEIGQRLADLRAEVRVVRDAGGDPYLEVARVDGRGLIQACRAAASSACGPYGRVSVA
jgi:hypothetical protein